jgi:2'-5' RNA ligase
MASQTTRTFIALTLNESVQQALADIQNHLRAANEDIKWVKPSHIHLTLKFLGELKSRRLKDVLKAFPSLYPQQSPFSIQITHLGTFPPSRQPRIIWAGVDEKNAEKIQQLAAVTETGLTKIGFPKETRTFQAHVTLGRIRSGHHLNQLVAAIQSFVFPQTPIIQPIQQVVLFKSILTPQGPIYDPLATIDL